MISSGEVVSGMGGIWFPISWMMVQAAPPPLIVPNSWANCNSVRQTEMSRRQGSASWPPSWLSRSVISAWLISMATVL
jgi:hypothetical protein